MTCLWKKGRLCVSFMLYINRDSRNGQKHIPLRSTSFSQMRMGGRWTCICLHILRNGILFLKEQFIRRTRSMEKVVSAERKCRVFLPRHRSLSTQDMFLMKTILKMCLPCATISIFLSLKNTSLMLSNPPHPKLRQILQEKVLFPAEAFLLSSKFLQNPLLPLRRYNNFATDFITGKRLCGNTMHCCPPSLPR